MICADSVAKHLPDYPGAYFVSYHAKFIYYLIIYHLNWIWITGFWKKVNEKDKIMVTTFFSSKSFARFNLNIFILHRLRNTFLQLILISLDSASWELHQYSHRTCGPMKTSQSRDSNLGLYDCEADALPHDHGHHTFAQGRKNSELHGKDLSYKSWSIKRF